MSTTTLEVRLAQIAPHPSNPRRDLGDLTELAASIKHRGVLQDLVVAPVPDGFNGKAEYVIIAGHRRHAAAKLAKVTKIQVKVREDLTDPADQLGAMLEENGHRADLTPVEEATAVQGLLDLGLNQTKIAALTSFSKTRISERVRLSKLPADVKEKVHTHQVTITDALALAEFAGHEDLEEKVAQALGESDFRWVVESSRRALTARKEHEATGKEWAAAGVRILDEAPPEPDVDAQESPDDWYPLEGLLDGSDGVDEAVAAHCGVEVDNLDWSHVERWHRETCEGHAAYSENPRWAGGQSQWVSICTTPAVHNELLGETRDDTAPPGTTAKATADEAARQREEQQQQLAEDLAIAATVRRSHLAAVLAGAAGVDLDGAARQLLVEQITTSVNYATTNYQAEEATKVLAVLLSLPDDTDAAAVQAAADKFADKATLAQLVLLHQLVENASEEVHLASPQRMWAWGQAKGHLRLTGGPLGYEWSEAELGWLPDDAHGTFGDDDEQVSA